MLKKITLFVFILTLGIFPAPLLAWSDPPAAPPNCPAGAPGCDIPLNVSANGQTKLGALILGGLRSLTDAFVDGKIGIGTVYPSAPLHIHKAPVGGLPAWVGQIFIDPNVNNMDAGLTLKATHNNIPQSWSIIAGSGLGDSNFRIYGSTGGDVMNITTAGNTGIGTKTPASRLDVAGDVCWTPVGGTRRCLGGFDPGNVTGGTNYWSLNQSGNLKNNNTGGQVNIQGQIKIEGGNPANNRLLVSNTAGLAEWKDPSAIPGVGGIGGDFLQTTFYGCAVGAGCFLKSGDSGPTQRVRLLEGGAGSVVMSCPSGYKVVGGGAECDRSFQAGLYAGAIAFLSTSAPTSATEWEVQCTKYFLNNWSFAQIVVSTAAAIKNASITCAK